MLDNENPGDHGAERSRIEDALHRAAIAVSSIRGEDVFAELARYLATTLDVELAMIGELTAPDAQRVSTLAVCYQGRPVKNFVSDLINTPCENVVGQRYRYIATGLLQQFPRDGLLQKFGFDSYAAYRLFDTQGQALGLVVVMGNRPLTDAALAEPLLRIASIRAAAELERRYAEAARQTSENSYREIFENCEDAIFIHDIDSGTIVDVNPKACAAYGYSREEMRCSDVGMVSSGTHPYTQEEALKLIARARAGETVRFEWHRKNKDGSLYWDEVVLKRAVIAGCDRILGFSRDITQRKQAESERAQLEAQLLQAQKMEALGHLTGGIAHDFNNLLTGIIGYALLAKERSVTVGDAKLSKYLQRIGAAGERARELIQQMLTFSRGQRGEPQSMSLPRLIGEVVDLYSATFPASVEFFTELDDSARRVMIDPVQAEQVLMNLCINARDAVERQGTVKLRVVEQTAVHAVCASCRQRIRGDFVVLTVADSGPGIAPEVQERMFEPFFTTKEIGKGSGMGLATIHGIVHKHAGHIMVDTAVGAGTTFSVLFPPVATGTETDSGTRPEKPDARTGQVALSGRILIVDDEESIADFMQELLEYEGFSVVIAGSAEQALNIFNSDPDAFDLVITDQTMPKMTGVALARQLLQRRPGLPVILYTGYSEELTEEIVTAAGIRGLLRKPVDIERLFELLRQLLKHQDAA
jgi:PAS domain S-box-containing protein